MEEQGKKQRRKFDKQFKEDAVGLVTHNGRRVTVALDLGINANVLHRWKREMFADGDHAFPGKGKLKPDEELRQQHNDERPIRWQRIFLQQKFVADRPNQLWSSDLLAIGLVPLRGRVVHVIPQLIRCR